MTRTTLTLCSISMLLIAVTLAGCSDSDPQSFEVQAQVNGQNGDVTPAFATVKKGQTTEFTLTPASGYRVQSAEGCGGELNQLTYRTGAITADCTVTVTFASMVATPTNIVAESGDGEITFFWDPVAEADAHHLYIATESEVTPENFSERENGLRVEAIESPYTLTDLKNHTTYYAVITASQNVGGTEYESVELVEVAARPAPPFEAIGGLNDTGVDWCLSDQEDRDTCPAVGFAHQDGDHGRDAIARDEQLAKIGGGRAGFDFSKLDSEGKVLAIQDRAWQEDGSESEGTQWSCVRDNVTGLIWEVKLDGTAAETPQHYTHTFTWYNPDEASNGGAPGVQNGGECAAHDMACDTQAYVAFINSQNLCGADDWRLPTVQELKSMSDYSLSHGGTAIDLHYFPNALAINRTSYSSATPLAVTLESPQEASEFIHTMSYHDGIRALSLKSSPRLVKLVRGGQPQAAHLEIEQESCLETIFASTPSSDFIEHADGTVVHTPTNLMWMRCSVGQQWNGETCVGEPEHFVWADALQTGAELDFAGLEDWRVPNVRELSSIIESSCTAPAINSSIFPNTPGDGEISPYELKAFSYWTATPAARTTLINDETGKVIAIDFGTGLIDDINAVPESEGIVRLVRDVSRSN